MIITITSIELSSRWKFFRLSWFGFKIMQQLKGEAGFVKMLKTGSGTLHFTLTVWDNEADLKRFARTGAHLEAMKASRLLARETRSYTYSTDVIPNWKEARELLFTQGKVISWQAGDKTTDQAADQAAQSVKQPEQKRDPRDAV